MSFDSEFWELQRTTSKKKKKKDEEEQKKLSNKLYAQKLIESDLAPHKIVENNVKSGFTSPLLAPTVTRTTTDAPIKSKKDDERTWFKKGSGDIVSTILGTVVDIGEDIGTGVIGMGEKAVDALSMLGTTLGNAQMSQLSNDELAFSAVKNIGKDKKTKEKEAESIVKKYNTAQKDAKKGTTDFVKKDLYDEAAIAKKIITTPFQKATDINVEESSVLGDKSDALIQSGGQLLATAGLSAIGVPWFLTTGATSFGAEAENALKQGATYEQATMSAAVSAGAEILTEKLSGGIKFKMPGMKAAKTLDDILVKPFLERISNDVVKTLATLGVDAVGEGAEEILSGMFSNLGSALYKEEDLTDILFSKEAWQEYLEGFIGGMALGGFSSGVRAVADRNKIELSENEQKVFDKVVEDRIAEATEDGKKTISKKDESKIRNNVLRDMLKGYIDTDTIESVLGGEEYEAYKKAKDLSDENIASGNEVIEKLKTAKDTLQAEYDTLYKMKNGEKSDEQIDRQSELKEKIADIDARIEKTQGVIKNLGEDTRLSDLKTKLGQNVSELVKDSRLGESYNEVSRRKQSFEADLSKYDAKQQETVKKAVESGILNNTNRTHEFVDMIAKISADKGVSFDFTDNQKLKESGFAIEGKTVNGLVTKDGIKINVNSAKALNSVVGHEITHILEGTELYTELQTMLKVVAESKGEYQSRYDEIRKLYEGIEGANIEQELTADLVGDYLFTDREFISRLSAEKPGVFKKIFDEIKYLCKVATAGSKEARKLEKVKKTFEELYKESKAEKNTADEVKYSVTSKMTEEERYTELKSKQIEITVETDTLNHLEAISSLDNLEKKIKSQAEKIIYPLAEKLGITTKELTHDNIDVEFIFSKTNGLKESLSKQLRYGGNYTDFAKALVNLEKILDNAVLIEVHGDKYKGTSRENENLEAVYVLLGAFKDESHIIPVQMEIKKSSDVGGRLYMTVALTKIEADVLGSTPENIQTRSLISASTYSISDIVQKINPKDAHFLKYIPDKMLSTEQIQAKKVALAEDAEKIKKYRWEKIDKDYLKAIKKGDTETTQKMVDEVARKNGYTIHSYHGTRDKNFTEFKKDFIGSRFSFDDKGFFFIDRKTIADDYAHSEFNADAYGRVLDVYLKVKKPLMVDKNFCLKEGLGNPFRDDDAIGVWDAYSEFFKEEAENRKSDGIILDDGMSKMTVVFDPNQIKSADAVTYDDNGNVIPLSKRFNTEKKDIRYSLSSKETTPAKHGDYAVYGEVVMLQKDDLAPVKEAPATVSKTEKVEPTAQSNVPTVNEDDYAPMTEAEANAMYEADKEYINTFTDADMPPEMDAPIYMPDTTSIDDKTLNTIAKTVKDALSLTTAETKAMKDIIQKYSTAEYQSEADLFEEIRTKFGEKSWTERNKEIANVKQVLRGYKVNVSPTIKRDITDYAQFRRRNFGKITFSKEGIPVDTAYMELSDTYPNFFPASITNATDQLLQMAEVANMEINEAQTEMLDDESIQEAAELIVDVVNTYKEKQLQKATEKDSRAALRDELKKEKEAQKELTPLDNYKKRANARLEVDKAILQEEFEQKKAELQKEIGDKNTFIGDKALKLYKELTHLKKGVRASQELGYFLDLGFKWSELKSTLLKVSKWPDTVLNPESEVESVVREAIYRDYEDKYDNGEYDLDVEYDKQVKQLEAETQKKIDAYKVAAQRKTKQQDYKAQMEELIGDTSTWVDKKLGIFYAVNTLRRNLRDIVRDENGNRDVAKADAIYDELQGKYNHNEAELNRESNRIKQRFAEMKITKAEDIYIQMLGELRHNPETTLEEDVVKAYYEKHKKHIDEAKVDKIIDESRKLYDDLLERVNKVLSEQGMKEIPYRKGYFPHFTEDKQGFLGKLFNWKTQNNEIPTSIAGLTEMFEPNRSWQSFNKQRKTDVTDYSFTKGLDNYVQGSLDWIYHIEDIQKRRAFENQIRYTHSDEGIQKKIDAIFNSEEYDADEMQEQVDLVYREARNPLNNFIQDFHTATNSLAGKKSTFDRDLEQRTNRKVYSVMTNLSNRVSGNMVAGSVSSALTNFIPITQSWVEVSPVTSLRAMKDTIASTIRDDGMIDKSDFLTNRLKKAENLNKTIWDKAGKGVGFLMDVIDGFTSQTVWRSKYIQNMSRGKSESEAIKNADIFAANVMADRSRGNQPTLFDSKSPVAKIFTVFQLEVNNQYGYFFKDAPQDVANKSKTRLAVGYATAFFGAYAYNALYSSLTGRDAAFDPIGIIEDLMKDLGFGDDDEEEEIAPVSVALNLTNNILEEIPFIGGLLGGGRIPISSAMPYGGIMEAFEGTLQDFSEGNYKTLTKEWLNPIYYLAMPMGGGQIRKTNQGLAMFSDEHPVAGSYTDSGSLRFPVEDNLKNRIQAGVFGQYANENARTYFDEDYAPLKEKQIQEYAEADMPIADYWKYREGLKEFTTQAEKADYINGLDISKEQKNVLKSYLYDEEGYKEKNPEKYAFLESEGIGYIGYKELDEDTQSAWSWAFKHQDEYEYYKENGVLPGDYSTYYIPMLEFEDEDDEAYQWSFDNPEKATVGKVFGEGVKEYREYSEELNEIRADKDSNGKAISGSAKEKKKAYIWSLDIDEGAKCILFRKEYPSDDSYNGDIINYLLERDDISYEDKKTILEELDFIIDDDGRITWK